MGLGGTRKMDFEYQAFVLAYRRCLDYLAGAIASYFKTEVSSFRTLPKSISKSKMASTITTLRGRKPPTSTQQGRGEARPPADRQTPPQPPA